MVRTQISLTEAQKRRLDAMAAQSGLSMADLIREAIDARYPETRDVDSDIGAIQRARGTWRDREFDGESYVERIRPAQRPAE